MTGLTIHIPAIETERLILRAPSTSDFDALWAFFQDERSRFVRAPDIDRMATARALGHMAGQWVLRGYGPFIMESRETGATVGLAGLWYPLVWPEPEMSWSIWSPEAEGKGYAVEGVRAALRHTFETVGLTSCPSFIDPENARSVALAERLGATLDPDTKGPDPDDLVYRHRPGAAA